MSTEILFLTDVPLSKQVRIARIFKGWNQWETAFHATECLAANDRFHPVKVQPIDVSFIELRRRVSPWGKRAIFAVPGVQGDGTR